MPDCDGKGTAERSYPTLEVRGRSREDPMPEGQRPRGVTPRPRSGQWPRAPDCDGAGTAERSYPASEVRGAAERRYPPSKVRGGGREEIPHAPSPRPGAVAGSPDPTQWLCEHRMA